MKLPGGLKLFSVKGIELCLPRVAKTEIAQEKKGNALGVRGPEKKRSITKQKHGVVAKGAVRLHIYLKTELSDLDTFYTVNLLVKNHEDTIFICW